MSSLSWDTRPTLRDPVLVAGFTGWNDAGDAASDAVAWLAGRFGAQRFAILDPESHLDFQSTRPNVELLDGVTREIRWPSNRFEAATTADGPDLVLLSGPEPSYRWREFCAGVVTVARETGCHTVVTLGALLADAPHTRPVSVTGATSDPETMDRLGLQRSRYEGPTGIVGVLHDVFRAAGIASASLWAPVPHYVAAPPNPPATRALLDRLSALTSLTLDLRELGVSSEAWRTRVDGAIAQDEDLRDYVRGLEEHADDGSSPDPELTTGDALAEAFEEYLREQGLE